MEPITHALSGAVIGCALPGKRNWWLPVWAALVALVRARCCSFVAALTADSVTVQAGVAIPVLHRIPRRAVTGVQLLRAPLLGAAGCTVLLVRSPGLQLVLPGIPAAQATALAAVLMEGNV